MNVDIFIDVILFTIVAKLIYKYQPNSFNMESGWNIPIFIGEICFLHDLGGSLHPRLQ